MIDPVYPCREMPTRHCPAVYDGVCGDRPCARADVDEPPWLPEVVGIGDMVAFNYASSHPLIGYVLGYDPSSNSLTIQDYGSGDWRWIPCTDVTIIPGSRNLRKRFDDHGRS